MDESKITMLGEKARPKKKSTSSMCTSIYVNVQKMLTRLYSNRSRLFVFWALRCIEEI